MALGVATNYYFLAVQGFELRSLHWQSLPFEVWIWVLDFCKCNLRPEEHTETLEERCALGQSSRRMARGAEPQTYGTGHKEDIIRSAGISMDHLISSQTRVSFQSLFWGPWESQQQLPLHVGPDGALGAQPHRASAQKSCDREST
jgi:hypothetical protein